jgi:glycosyltransferase involved in cell wall biosynthesis
MQVLHIITDFNDGGAQAVLYRFITSDKKNVHRVISLMTIGWYGDRLSELGVQVDSLNMPKSRLTLSGLTKLYRLIRQSDPDTVQTWMYHSDLIGGLMARLAGNKSVIWGIHNSNLDRDKTAMTTRLIARACAMLSGNIPQKIISCAEESSRIHIALGYKKQKMVVVANGYDVSEFSPKLAARIELRDRWKIAENTTLFGMVARWDPQKDHANLIAALAELTQSTSSPWHCVLIGSNLSEDNQILMTLLDRSGVKDRVSLLGVRNDIPAVMNALDLHILASAYGEAFPNVVAEAMACGTPCVVTDVGDAGVIVGDAGWVVPASNPIQLATAMFEAIKERSNSTLWRKRQTACRSRIQENFNLQIMADKYNDVWSRSQK